MAKGLVGFYLLVKYELGVSTLSHFGFHFAQTRTVAHRGLTHTQVLP